MAEQETRERRTSNGERLVLIMAGGAGTRFWPASRESRPKQFLDILGTGKSLLRQTFERSQKLVPADRIFVITNATSAGQVQAARPELMPDQIFLEPSRNNTAPCIA
jgi:mannose-1-phosphate guanylyltransferase